MLHQWPSNRVNCLFDTMFLCSVILSFFTHSDLSNTSLINTATLMLCEGCIFQRHLSLFAAISNPTGDSNAFIPVIVHPPFDAFCDYDGWLLIQRRFSAGELSFDVNWREYKQGFGDITGEHWLGLEKIYQLTSQNQSYTLSVSLDVGQGIKFYALYDVFRISSEADGYALHVGQYNGTAGDLLSSLNGARFSALDQDNDAVVDTNCAAHLHGGWWFTDCDTANPNSETTTWPNLGPIAEVEMKIKPTS